MRHHRGHMGGQLDEWSLLTTDGQEVAGNIAVASLTMPAFFLGWVGLGVLVGAGLGRRGHDRGRMLALGAGLGPLMLVAAAEARHRARQPAPLVLSPGTDHGGDLDILVLVQDRPEDVHFLGPTLDAVQCEVGTLTLARAVDYEWLEDGPAGARENDVVAAATSALVAARDLVPITGPALVVLPGQPDAAARAFAARSRRTLVLVAIGDVPAALERW